MKSETVFKATHKDTPLFQSIVTKISVFLSVKLCLFELLITAAECSDLDNPDNGQVFLSGTTIGATASYSCSAGYELIGDRTRTCQSNGQWSGGEPSCKS